MTLLPELELAVVVASVPVTAVTVTLGGETVVPAATDVTTTGVFVVDVTLGAVETIVATAVVTAVVAPPAEVLTETAGRVKAAQVSSKVLINLFAESSTSEVGVFE
jgi:hypothetical protein